MHQHAATSVEPGLDEAIAGRKVLEEVLVLDIVDLYYAMSEAVEQLTVQRQPQDGEHMCDTRRPQRFSPA